jgi:transposase
MMKKTRRTYDREFKLEVVRRSLEEMSVKDLGKELGINPAVISRWRKEFLDTEDQEIVFRGKGKEVLSEEEKEIKRLNKALKEKELELEILKKAIGIFSKKDKISTNL